MSQLTNPKAEWKVRTGEVIKGIVDNFLIPVKDALLQPRECRTTHSREDIEEKFGPGGVKGCKGWVAPRKPQGKARRDRLKNKSGLDSTGKLTKFELLRPQMFSRSDEANAPMCSRACSSTRPRVAVGRDRRLDSGGRPVLPGEDGKRTVTGVHGRILAQKKEPGMNPVAVQGMILWALRRSKATIRST